MKKETRRKMNVTHVDLPTRLSSLSTIGFGRHDRKSIEKKDHERSAKLRTAFHHEKCRAVECMCVAVVNEVGPTMS